MTDRLTDEELTEVFEFCQPGNEKPLFVTVVRALATEAQVAALREALRVWGEAFATGRNEPLVAAYENGQRAIGEKL